MAYDYDWENWPERFKARMKEAKKSLKMLGSRSDRIGEEVTLRSYLNGHRQIALRDFFALCAQINADPHEILFGQLALTRDEAKAVGDRVVQTLMDLRPHPTTRKRAPPKASIEKFEGAKFTGAK